MAETPLMDPDTNALSKIEPTRSVNGELLRSRPTAGTPFRRKVLSSASPKCPALPVTRTAMAKGNTGVPRHQVSRLSGGVIGRRARPVAQRGELPIAPSASGVVLL